jgi:pimeloyl-ACP methyl ester carboxylesterase
VGSHPATWGESLAGLILDSPYADGLALIHRLGGPLLDRTALPGSQDNIDKMAGCTMPCLIIHGTDDRIIPLTDAERLHEVCRSDVKELLKIKGAGHNNLLAVGLSEYFGRLREFILTNG